MENSLKKLNETLNALTTEQMGLEGDDLLTSLKAVKSVVRAIELIAKIGKVKPTDPTPPTEPTKPDITTEPEVVETEPEPTETTVTAEVIEEAPEAADIAEVPTEAVEAVEAAVESAVEASKPTEDYQQILTNIVRKAGTEDNSMFTIWGGDGLRWCDYPMDVLPYAGYNLSYNKYCHEKQRYISEVPLLNPAECRSNSRHHFSLEDSGKTTLYSGYNGGSGELKACIMRRRGKMSCLCLYKEQDKGEILKRGEVVRYIDSDMDGLKKVIFGL